ncbi:hypothetical protein FLJC2902T_23310 [Flavobacterium limnosediminis JC2902]|uniref:DUF4239 domain-containing protein n=1 Tax=Flavobacterium limnosediminis JC2902 TaxID=1341181 RepID=V6SRD4_9FLAO|nr:hypothetical protein [Flavobacterium limnosediminis]ESU26990.1 hypothetical protein FLJC2902T_23310 [Flavobacterium limnosediminis JC2902]
MDNIPISVFFLATCLIVVLSIDVGYRVGKTIHKTSDSEKESPVSGISGSILGLLVFILVFTFNIVSERYDTKRSLVRQEAGAIRATWLRSEFLPEPDRSTTRNLIKEYVNSRANVHQIENPNQLEEKIALSTKTQDKLFAIAVTNARKDMNSDVAALYIESLNEMINLHFMRVAVGWQARIPNGIWTVLFILIVLSMFAVGYQTAIAGSSRSWSTLILTISFSIVITLIAILDRPENNYITVPQQSMIDLRDYINSQK